MQNSGVGNALNLLQSLLVAHGIPAVLLVGMRGGADNEPQHEVAGRATEDVLRVSGVATLALAGPETLDEAAARAAALGLPVGVTVWSGASTSPSAVARACGADHVFNVQTAVELASASQRESGWIVVEVRTVRQAPGGALGRPTQSLPDLTAATRRLWRPRSASASAGRAAP